jgi:hypothetical protein
MKATLAAGRPAVADYLASLGQVLRCVRLLHRHRYSQRRLGALIGVSGFRIWSLENGIGPGPRPAELERIAEVLGCPDLRAVAERLRQTAAVPGAPRSEVLTARAGARVSGRVGSKVLSVEPRA